MPTPYSGEQLEKLKKSREVADNIAAYLNQMEQICSQPMSEQEKAESFNQMALYVGKTMVAFTQLCEDVGVYEERGVRGGIIRGKKKADKEQFEYEEV